MEVLIIIAIAAFALLLTGLTDFQALRRPSRTTTDRTEEPADHTGAPPTRTEFCSSNDQCTKGRQRS